MVLPLFIIPIALLPLLWLARSAKALHVLNLAGATLQLLAGAFLTVQVYQTGSVQSGFPIEICVDSLNIIFLDLVLVIGWLVSLYSAGYIGDGTPHGATLHGGAGSDAPASAGLSRVRLYYALVQCFVFSMYLSLLAGNLGIMWIGIEATTLASAFLVGFENTKKSIEAAWKYVIICSVGIALALLGVIFMHLASAGIVAEASRELSWIYLLEHASELPAAPLRLSFIFVLIGFGTKAGLAPMHTWLPDAHSQAPSPISALLSGVLLNSALYGIMRVLTIVNRSLGSDFARPILLGTALLSVFAAAFLILAQKDYKRLLAYSSIEHMGLAAFGLATFSPAAVFAALLHLVNHSITKSMLFLAAGQVYQKTGEKEIQKISGLFKIMPLTASIILLGAFAITGMPPFSVFFSEWGLLASAFQALPDWLPILLLALLAVVFAGFAINLFGLFFGQPADPALTKGEVNRPGLAAMLVLLLLALAGGLLLPREVLSMIGRAQAIITGGTYG